MSSPLTVVLSRRRVGVAEGQVLEEALLKGLAQWSELPLMVIPHLYDLSYAGPSIQALRGIAGDMVVLSWLYPRAAFWVLQAQGIIGRMGSTPLVPEEELEPPDAGGGNKTPTPERTIWCLDLRTFPSPERYLAEIARLAHLPQPLPTPAAASVASETSPTIPPSELPSPRRIQEILFPRWYPVIDRARCRNCLECLNFCLFGVYGLDEKGRVWVEMPDACRPGCPACARVCPSGAIMFPHYSDPAIAGAPEAHPAPSSTPPESDQTKTDKTAADQTKADQTEFDQTKAADSSAPEARSLDRLVDELDQIDP